ncbi:hypothetical protein Tco_0587016 [Tanacetum coccineum]
MPAYKPIMKFLLNCPLNKAFTNCPSVVYQNFLREFWSTTVAYDPFPSTDETEQRPLREFLINFSVLNGQRPLTLDFNTFCSSTGLRLLRKNWAKLPSIRVLGGKTYSSTVQGPKASGALSKKRQKHSPKKHNPSETKVTPPKPTEGSEQSHSVSLGTVPDPQDLERNIQLASTIFSSTLDEGSSDLTSTTSDEGTAKTTPHPEGSLGDKDLGGNIPPADMEPVHPTVADLQGEWF